MTGDRDASSPFTRIVEDHLAEQRDHCQIECPGGLVREACERVDEGDDPSTAVGDELDVVTRR